MRSGFPQHLTEGLNEFIGRPNIYLDIDIYLVHPVYLFITVHPSYLPLS